MAGTSHASPPSKKHHYHMRQSSQQAWDRHMCQDAPAALSMTHASNRGSGKCHFAAGDAGAGAGIYAGAALLAASSVATNGRRRNA
eukprot:354622-Chlamydomonas_euryale.AAC.9